MEQNVQRSQVLVPLVTIVNVVHKRTLALLLLALITPHHTPKPYHALPSLSVASLELLDESFELQCTPYSVMANPL